MKCIYLYDTYFTTTANYYSGRNQRGIVRKPVYAPNNKKQSGGRWELVGAVSAGWGTNPRESERGRRAAAAAAPATPASRTACGVRTTAPCPRVWARFPAWTRSLRAFARSHVCGTRCTPTTAKCTLRTRLGNTLLSKTTTGLYLTVSI